MPKISLIVPVYNVESYLRECVESCINQTFRDIEIICIDDCSTDNSINILNEYAYKDIRVKIVKHEKNKGLGAARNTGIESANGEYIWFIDSDDYIALDACKIFYDIIIEEQLDILRFESQVFVDKDGDKHFVQSDYYSSWPYNKRINLKNYKNEVPLDFMVSSCMYVTKRSCFGKIRFAEGVYFEDTDFTPILFSNVDSIMCINYSGYFRRLTPCSITQRRITTKHLRDRCDVILRLEKFLKNDNNRYLQKMYESLIQGFGIAYVNENIDVADEDILQIVVYLEKIVKKQKLKKIFSYLTFGLLNKINKINNQ